MGEGDEEDLEVKQYPKFQCSRRKRDKGKRIEAVYFVPHTQEGALRTELMKMKDTLGLKSRLK